MEAKLEAALDMTEVAINSHNKVFYEGLARVELNEKHSPRFFPYYEYQKRLRIPRSRYADVCNARVCAIFGGSSCGDLGRIRSDGLAGIDGLGDRGNRFDLSPQGSSGPHADALGNGNARAVVAPDRRPGRIRAIAGWRARQRIQLRRTFFIHAIFSFGLKIAFGFSGWIVSES